MTESIGVSGCASGASPAVHPLLEGSAFHREAEPCILVIFGATGDLTARKLIPALYQLGADSRLPHHFACIGFARRQKDDALFRKEMAESIEKYARVQPVQKAQWDSFADTLFYHCSDFHVDEGYETLKERMERLDAQLGTRGNRLYYLSTQPEEFPTILGKLKKHGLIYPVKSAGGPASGAVEEEPWSRVVIEKPFGYDYASAVSLQREISQFLDESQCYRIDHWLGKETVQNLLVFRFTNAIFESLWNRHFIDHVQISVAEELGVGSRGKLWEHSGMLRDIVQNHVMQLISLIAMEPPTSLAADAVRNEKVKVIEAMRPFTKEDLRDCIVRGQYGPGFIQGSPVPGYREEKDVPPDSSVETYVAMRLFIDNWRWAGVPFYIRAGKRLVRRTSEIAITFKQAPGILYDSHNRLQPNVLLIRIQPGDSILLTMNCKVPGQEQTIQRVGMDFRYSSYFSSTTPEAYERLLCDVMSGDSTLFARIDELLASWTLLTPVLRAWNAESPPHFPNYAAGLMGPAAADRLLHQDNRAWYLL